MIVANKGRRALAAFVAVLLLATGFAPVAVADESAAFGMSKSSVRAGEATQITEIDPCPAPTSGMTWGNNVWVKFTDGLGEVSTWNTIFDAQGHWGWTIQMTPPHRRLLSYDPPTYSNDAWPGAGVVEVTCEEMDIVTLTYASKTLTVTGPAAGFTVSPGTLKAGSSAHFESVLPCPSGSAVVDFQMSYTPRMRFHFLQAAPDVNGDWSIDTVIPADFPEGFSLLAAFCRPPGINDGQRTQAYAETFAMVNVDKINYVAMGDSYSSGEGVEPFESGTDGEGGCHRSAYAYPRLLEEDFSPELKLDGDFVACSGDTTAGITLGGPNPAQMDVLTANTDFVTMTIGGNNMQFPEFAAACAVPPNDNACVIGGSATNAAMSRIVNNVIPQMEYMLGTVRDRLITLGNADAVVLVLGYPQIVPETWAGAAGCWWLTEAETAAIRHVTTHLNTAIKNEVDAIGYDFHFVSATDSGSPFIGHEICRDYVEPLPSYFNDVVIGGPDEYTFHPNQAGQAAYADLVKDWLTANPLS